MQSVCLKQVLQIEEFEELEQLDQMENIQTHWYNLTDLTQFVHFFPISLGMTQYVYIHLFWYRYGSADRC